MKILTSLKSTIGRRVLAKESEAVRIRQGFNFHTAQRIAFLYIDHDEEFYKRLKLYAQYLKITYQVKTVHLMGYVPHTSKEIPVWQQHVLESDFFCLNDLNWHHRPLGNSASFASEDYDVLIDFSGGDSVPLNFILKDSKAHMKVGIKGSYGERYCDFIIDMGNTLDIAHYVEQLNYYLSNPKIK